MKCPECAEVGRESLLKVLETRTTKRGQLTRRRVCAYCERRFSSVETLVRAYDAHSGAAQGFKAAATLNNAAQRKALQIALDRIDALRAELIEEIGEQDTPPKLLLRGPIVDALNDDGGGG